MADRSATFESFWPRYLAEHAAPATRAVHVAGTWTAFAVLLLAILVGPSWLLLLVPVIGYGAAWASHALIERNRPTTFIHPLWSLRGDLRMAGLAARGRLGEEIRRHGV